MHIKTIDIANLPALINPHSACLFVINKTDISNCVNDYFVAMPIQDET